MTEHQYPEGTVMLDAPVEVVELREERIKHFIVGHTPDGDEVREAKQFPLPVHYDFEGEWLDIRPRWIDGTLVGVGYEATLDGIGCEHIKLLDHVGTPSVRENRVWWHAIAPDTSAVLVASYKGVRLHLVLWGPNAPREWRFWHAPDQDVQVGGRDNIERYVLRSGREQNYELEIEVEEDRPIVVKRWTGRIKALDEKRRRYWSDDVLYPVRVM